MEQIITGEGQLVPRLDEQIAKSGIADAGVDYHMVAIIGAQSSGKSTILNLLFGTKFETMNETTGRQQTTKGIHAAKSVDSPLLLFDVEGCDSRERGDSDALFERKSALFALALSEVLIINMWESDIGRYNASNIPMLKTVFEVNVQLFLAQNTTKSKILFVIRDCTAPNFEAITWQLNRDMANIWDEIELPKEFKGKQITDFFEFQFYSIHHMKIEREKFDSDVNELRGWFIDEKNEHYLFKEQSSKVVPGEGLSQYIRNLWGVINENKELNLPSQRTMLARFKCDENAKIALEKCTEEIKTKMETIIDKTLVPLPHFKETGDEIVEKALKSYHDSSWRYNETIVKEREDELKNEIKAVLKPVFEKHCSIIANNVITEFITFMGTMKSPFVKGGKWSLQVQEKIDNLIMTFNDEVDKAKVSPFVWNFPVYSTQTSMTEKADGQMEILIEDAETTILNENIRQFREKADVILKEVNDTMWEDLKNLMNNSAKETEDEIVDILSTNAPKHKPKMNILEAYQNEALTLVKVSANFIMLKMKAAFDKNFKYEKNGRPRVWKRRDNINEIYEESRKKALRVLRLFTYCRLGEENAKPNDPLKQVLIPRDKLEEIEVSFERVIIHAYEEAKSNIRAMANNEKIPAWAWVALFVCSGDYILKFLSNPFFFVLFAIFGGTYFILRQLGLWDIAQTTMLNKFNALLNNLTENEEKPAEEEKEKEKEKIVEHKKQEEEVIEQKNDQELGDIAAKPKVRFNNKDVKMRRTQTLIQRNHSSPIISPQ